MKKTLLIIALVIGSLAPFFAHTKEVYYLALLSFIALLFFAFRKKPIAMMDFLILFIITIPLHTFRLGGTEHFIRLSEIAFLPLFVWWVIVRFLNKAGESFLFRKEFVLLFIFLVINLISTSNSMFPGISLKRVMILAYLFVFTYIVSDSINNREKLSFVIQSMILISGISAVIAVLQSFIPSLLIFNQVAIGRVFGITFYRASAGWHDPNYYALYLVMNAALTLACILSRQEKSVFLKRCFALQCMGILVTFSRTILISLLLVSIYLLWHYQRKRAAKILLVTITAAFLLLSTAALSIYKDYPFLAKVVYRVADKEKLKKEPTLVMGHRAAAFIANWSMFVDHPFIGVGPFMAMYNFEKYRPEGYSSPNRTWLASHNQYLQLLSEKGIFGFLVFMAFIAMVLRKINRLIVRENDPQINTYLVGLKSAIFCYLISSIGLETSYELQFWLTIGLCLAIFNLSKKNAATE